MIVVHNKEAGVTVVATVDHEGWVDFAYSMCKRNEDAFSKKRGYRTAVKRLERKPDTAGKISPYTNKIRLLVSAIKSLPKRRTKRDVINTVVGVFNEE